MRNLPVLRESVQYTRSNSPYVTRLNRVSTFPRLPSPNTNPWEDDEGKEGDPVATLALKKEPGALSEDIHDAPFYPRDDAVLIDTRAGSAAAQPDALFAANHYEANEAIERVTMLFAEWKHTDGRSREAAWQTISVIYEIAPSFPPGSVAHQILAERVEERLAEQDTPSRYRTANKGGEELLLTLYFGTEEDRVRKSQWAKALRVAATLQPEPVARTSSAMFHFLKGESGISGVGKLNRNNERAARQSREEEELEELLVDLKGMGHPGVVPQPEFQSEPFRGFQLTLTHTEELRAGENDGVPRPVFSTADPKLIMAVIRERNRQIKSSQTDALKEMDNRFKQLDRKLNADLNWRHKKEWRTKRKQGKTDLTLNAYARDIEGLDPLAKDFPNWYRQENDR